MTLAVSSITWESDVKKHDFHAARSYLSLRLDPKRARAVVKCLKRASIQHFRANDILRAASLAPASPDDASVAKDLKRIAEGTALSPVLLMNLDVGCEIADGYHRVSAVYHRSPFELVPARLA